MAAVSLAIIAVICVAGYFLASRRALALGEGTRRNLHSLPRHHARFVALWAVLPAVAFVLLVLAVKDPVIEMIVLDDLKASADGELQRNESLALSRVIDIASDEPLIGQPTRAEKDAARLYSQLNQMARWLMLAGAGVFSLVAAAFAFRSLRPDFWARNRSERLMLLLLLLCAVVAILTTIGIVFSVLFESIRFFGRVPLSEFFFSLKWSPQTAIREGQVAAEGTFGIIPLMVGTMLITAVAMCVAIPIGTLSAIYMAEFARLRVRAVAKPILEILAGVPTVVYGFFAAVTVAPFVQDVGQSLGLAVSSQSALAAGSVMGIMLIPFVSSLSDDAINAVPQKLRDAAYTAGATQGETIRQVVLPAAFPGLVSAFLLAISRAIGETMIVVMAAGLAANLTANPLEEVTTVTVQITTLLTGDQEFGSAKTLSAFALGLVLFVATLILNVIALVVSRRYREQYD